jgi:hypothetical protein
MKKIVGPVLVFFFFSGCGHLLPPDRPGVVAPLSGPRTTYLPLDQRIDERISALTQMLEQGSLSQNDKEIATNLIVAYEAIKRASSHHFTEGEYDKFLYTLLNSLSLIHKTSFSTEREKTEDYLALTSQLAKKRRDIADAYLSGDFRGVINYSLEIKRVFGPNALTPEIALLFALALGKEGMREEAITIGEGVVRELEIMPDPIQLRASLAELQLQGGKRDRALLAYEKLTDTLDEHQAILRSLERKITTHTTAGEAEPHQAQGQHHRERAFQVEGSQDQIFQKVAQLTKEHRFGEARDLLTLKRNEMQSDPEREALDKALKVLEIAEEKYLENQVSLISRNREALKLAQKLLEEEKFEEAISRLDKVAVSEGEGYKIRMLKKQAIEKLINRERNRAAKLFLSAKKAQDPLEKEKQLYSTYEILKKLIEQYPSSRLNLKIKSHMKAVEDELNKLGKKRQ